MKGRLPRVMHASAPRLSWPNNEWSKRCTARRYRRLVELILQVLGLQFLVNSDASILDHCSSQEMGGGTKHLMSLVPLGRFEVIGNLKGFVSSSACFAFHQRPTADHFFPTVLSSFFVSVVNILSPRIVPFFWYTMNWTLQKFTCRTKDVVHFCEQIYSPMRLSVNSIRHGGLYPYHRSIRLV